MTDRSDPELARAEMIGGVIVISMFIGVIFGLIYLVHYVITHTEIFS